MKNTTRLNYKPILRKLLALVKWMCFPFLVAGQTSFSNSLTEWRTSNGVQTEYSTSLEWQCKVDLNKIQKLEFASESTIDNIVFNHAHDFKEVWYLYFTSHDPDTLSNKLAIDSISSTKEGKTLLTNGSIISSSEMTKNVNGSIIRYVLVLLINP